MLCLQKANRGKAMGIDEIPVEVLFNEISVTFLCNLFNNCYENGVFPTAWKMGIINPIPKGHAGSNNPSLYRGITLAVASYKLFCGILNNRQVFAEEHNLIADEQNGFRRERSCTDQILSLVNIVDTRIQMKQNTFAAFIDFRKAYDSINHELLWSKLVKNGIQENGKFLKSKRCIRWTTMCC